MDVNTDIYNPIFSHVMSITDENITMNPLAYIHFLIVGVPIEEGIFQTVDKDDQILATEIIGVGLFNIFLDSDTLNVPTEETEVKKK